MSRPYTCHLPPPRRIDLATSRRASTRRPSRHALFVWNAPPPNQTCTRPPTRAAAPSLTLVAWCRPPACMVGAPTAVPLSTICPASQAWPSGAETWGSAWSSPRPGFRLAAPPMQKSATMQHARSLALMPRNRRSLLMCASFAVAASPDPRWALPSCLPVGCTGRQYHTVDPAASHVGQLCGSACVVPMSWSGSACRSQAQLLRACGAMYTHAVGGGHAPTRRTMGVQSLP